MTNETHKALPEGMRQRTPEEMEEMRLKGAETRRKKIEWAKEHLRNDFADNPLWRELAKKYSVKLPLYYEPNTETKYLHRVFKKTKTCYKEYLEACGATSLKQLAAMNPEYPAYAEVGLLLEWVDEQYDGEQE